MSQFRRPTYPGDFERARANRLATLVLCGICFLGLLWLAFVCFFNEARAQTVPPALSQGTGSQSGTAVVNAANGTINILSYGAKCDGVATATTDTNGIKSAVAATHGVGKLLIPATGHPCLINSEIDLPDNNTLTVQGPGPSSSTYFLASSIPASSTMLYLGANSHTLLRDLQINCNALGGSVTGVNMQFMTNGEVSNVFTQNCDTGVAVQNSQENFFYNVHANLDGIGLYINASNSSQYLRILSQNSSTYNIQCSGCGASIFEIPLQDEGGATGGINELWQRPGQHRHLRRDVLRRRERGNRPGRRRDRYARHFQRGSSAGLRLERDLAIWLLRRRRDKHHFRGLAGRRVLEHLRTPGRRVLRPSDGRAVVHLVDRHRQPQERPLHQRWRRRDRDAHPAELDRRQRLCPDHAATGAFWARARGQHVHWLLAFRVHPILLPDVDARRAGRVNSLERGLSHDWSVRGRDTRDQLDLAPGERRPAVPRQRPRS